MQRNLVLTLAEAFLGRCVCVCVCVCLCVCVCMSTIQFTDLQVMQRSCASVVAGVHFSLLGRIDVDGFPKATL